jgi:hypothetical protein
LADGDWESCYNLEKDANTKADRDERDAVIDEDSRMDKEDVAP